MAVTSMIVACHAPTSTCDCHNGVDCEGRGPDVVLRVDCVPGGVAEVQCHATRVENGYCASGSLDVTSTVHWISTDPSVAAFDAPGHLRTLSPGGTATYVESESLYSQQAFGYLVGPAGSVQQVGVVDVSVLQAAPGGFLPLAMVEFTPQTGRAQTCRQGAGAPYTPCRFWSDLSGAVVRASRAGYTTAEQSVMPRTSNLSFPTGIVLRLSSLP